jgi:sugar phosphate isomerase/epimerase
MEAIDWVCSNGWKDPRYLRKISEDAGLTIAAHTILRSAFVQCSKDALDDFKRSLEFTCILGAPVMMQPPFPRVEQLSREDDFNAWKEFYAQTLPLAEACNITLTTEATGVINSPVTTADELLELMRSVPGLKCTLDHGNMETAEPSLDAYLKLKEYVVQIHLKDWKIFSSPQPGAALKRSGKYFADALIGTGDMDLKGFWNTLDARGRDLYVNLETMDYAGTSSTAEVLKMTADALRSW